MLPPGAMAGQDYTELQGRDGAQAVLIRILCCDAIGPMLSRLLLTAATRIAELLPSVQPSANIWAGIKYVSLYWIGI